MVSVVSKKNGNYALFFRSYEVFCAFSNVRSCLHSEDTVAYPFCTSHKRMFFSVKTHPITLSLKFGLINAKTIDKSKIFTYNSKEVYNQHRKNK